MQQKNKKIIFVLNSFRNGGAERLVLGLVKKFIATNYEVYLISLNKDGELRSSFEAEDIEIIIDDMSTLKSVSRMIEKLRSIKPDIIHLHLHLKGIKIAIINRLFIKARIYLTVHNTYKSSTLLRRVKHLLIRIFETLLINKKIAVSEAVMLHEQKYFFTPIKKITVIRNGIEIEGRKKYSKKKYSRRKPIKILSIGHSSIQKNHIFFIDLLKDIRKIDVQIDIAGKCNSTSKHILECASKIEKTKRINFLGNVENLKSKIASYDFIIQPSLWEGMPLAVLETIVIGTPILVSNISPHQEIVGNKALNLFDTNNTYNLIKKLELNYSIWEKNSKELQAKVYEQFSIDEMHDKYHQIFS